MFLHYPDGKGCRDFFVLFREKSSDMRLTLYKYHGGLLKQF
jgi:hypothetical protein